MPTEAKDPAATVPGLQHRLRLPVINANDTSAVVRRWRVAAGDRVEAGETVVEVETTKTVFEVESPWSGWIEPLAAVGERVDNGATLALIHPSEEAAAASRAEHPAAAEAAPRAPVPAQRPITDAARRLAEREGIDPAAVPGSGLLTEKALRRWLAERAESEAPPEIALQQGIALSLRRARDTAIPSFVARPVASAAALAFLEAYGRERRFLVSETDLLLKASGLTLEEFPEFNGWVEEGALRHHPEVHIAMALDVEGTLHTPTLKDPGALSLEEIAHWRMEQQLQAQRGRGVPAAAQPTFSLSSLTAYGIEFLIPNLAHRQTATLGVGVRGAARTPEGRWMLCLTFDHGVINGARGARFLAALASRLENPETLDP